MPGGVTGKVREDLPMSIPRNMAFTSIAAASPERIYVMGGLDETGSVVGTVFIGEQDP